MYPILVKDIVNDFNLPASAFREAGGFGIIGFVGECRAGVQKVVKCQLTDTLQVGLIMQPFTLTIKTSPNTFIAEVDMGIPGDWACKIVGADGFDGLEFIGNVVNLYRFHAKVV